MKKFVVVGFQSIPEQALPYEHVLPSGTEVVIIGPHKGAAANPVLRGIGEIFGIMRDIMRQRSLLKDIDLIFSEFREYTFFEIVLIKLFARHAKTVVYVISDFPESNYSRHHNIFFKYLLASLIALCQFVSDDVWFISEHLSRKYRLRRTKRFGVVRTSNLSEREIVVAIHPRPIAKDCVRLVSVGRLEKEKRFEILLRAVKILKDRGVPAYLTIAGDGALRNELERLAENIGIKNDVTFLGYVLGRANVLALYRDADISLLASEHEGLGLVLVESISQGAPAITNHFEGAEEIIHDGVDGYLVDAKDADALAEGMAAKIQYLYEHPDQYEMLSKNGPSGAKEFTLEAVGTGQRVRMEVLLPEKA